MLISFYTFLLTAQHCSSKHASDNDHDYRNEAEACTSLRVVRMSLIMSRLNSPPRSPLMSAALIRRTT